MNVSADDMVMNTLGNYSKRVALIFLLGFSMSFLYGQNNSASQQTTSRYSSKVFSEIDYLTRLAKKGLKREFKKLRAQEEAAYTTEYNAIIEGSAPVTQTDPRQQEVSGEDPKDVALLDGQFSLPPPAEPEPIEPEVDIDSFVHALYRKEIPIVSINVYAEKNKEEINKYLSLKLEGIYFKKYPRFLFSKAKEFFKYEYREAEEAFVLSYGPQDNAEITETLVADNKDYYARIYFFRLSDRSILDINIYDVDTHEVVWGKRYSIYVSFKEINLAYRFSLGVYIADNTALLFTNFIGVRLPVIGIYGIFFSLGVIAVDPLGARIYFNYSQTAATLFTFAIGPQISYSLNEWFGLSYICCEVFLDFQFGYKNNFTVSSSAAYSASEPTLRQNFTTLLGLSLSVRRLLFYAHYDALNNGFGGGIGFNF
ncbi:hypothetical protein COTS27_00055 [Spirochaetota bacterium]|nr:hypothetical protein COTS27_00055 [Spirochaetota bacterium]